MTDKNQQADAVDEAGAAEPGAARGEGTAPAEAEGAENRPTYEELMQKVGELQGKADQYWDELLRARAEMENVQRRAAKDLENAHKFGVEKIAAELLPVKDSLEMGLAAAEGEAVDAAKVREGVELTLKMLSTLMEKFAIREVNPQNERFNPDLHQAMSVQPSSEVEPNTVLTVYQKGYTLNERLLRPALVVVSQSGGGGRGGPSGSPEPGPEGGGKVDEMA